MNTQTQTKPCAVSQTLLDITGKALMTHDFDPFASVFLLPHEFETFDGKSLVSTRRQLHDLFRSMCSYHDSLGVTDLIRECIAAEYKSDTTIAATHLSHLMRNGTRLTEPYPVFSTLKKINGLWMITSGKYAVDSKTGAGRAIARNRNDDDDLT